jgi:hypothetical protein
MVCVEDPIALRYLVNAPWAWKRSLVAPGFASQNGGRIVCTLPHVVLKFAYATTV